MPKKPKLLSGEALKAEMDKLSTARALNEEHELKDKGAWPVVNDTFDRIKSDMSTKPSDSKIRALAKCLTRSNIRDIIEMLDHYTPCNVDSIEYEEELEDYNMSLRVAWSYGRRLEAIL